MKQEWLEQLRTQKTMDVDGYRYRLQDFGDYGEVRRLPIEQAEKTPDVWDWEFVEKVELEDPTDWGSGSISLDGGNTFLSAEEAMGEIRRRRLWDYIYEEMDEEIRDIVEDMELEDELEFLSEYLRLAEDDLIIG